MSTDIEKYVDEVEWGVQASIRYHERLAGRYDRYNRWVVLISLFFSAAAFGSLVQDLEIFDERVSRWVASGAALAIAFTTMSSLAFDFIGKAMEHRSLAKRWIIFCENLKFSQKHPDAGKSLQDLNRECGSIRADEPPTHKRLALWAELQASKVLGLSEPKAGWVDSIIRRI